LQGALAAIQVNAPLVPVINNVDVAIEQDPAAIRDALVRQAWHAVRWVEIIQAMRGQGITHVVECGPGKVLTGMVKRIDPEMVALSVTDPESMQTALDALAAA
jgi:[acyl-carrier-protein] S-malonyltransferase